MLGIKINNCALYKQNRCVFIINKLGKVEGGRGRELSESWGMRDKGGDFGIRE